MMDDEIVIEESTTWVEEAIMNAPKHIARSFMT
jgi:hypothetical protein